MSTLPPLDKHILDNYNMNSHTIKDATYKQMATTQIYEGLHEEHNWVAKWVVLPLCVVLLPLAPIIMGIYAAVINTMAAKTFKNGLAAARMSLVRGRNFNKLADNLIKAKNKKFTPENIERAADIFSSPEGNDLEKWRAFKKTVKNLI